MSASTEKTIDVVVSLPQEIVMKIDQTISDFAKDGETRTRADLIAEAVTALWGTDE